jgi:alkylation response protein AidB-like acyl-CoA dehydrogenase
LYLGLTEPQQMLRAAAQDFLAASCPLHVVRDIEKGAESHKSQLWAQLVELGWTGLIIPEKYGGLGGSFSDLVVLLEETGRVLLPGPFFSNTVLFSLPLLTFSSPGQNDRLLEQLAVGEVKGTLAMNELTGSYHLSDIKTLAVPEEDGFVLTGTKMFVSDAAVSDYLLIAAMTGTPRNTPLTVFLVNRNIAGLTIADLETFTNDGQAQIKLDNVYIPSGQSLSQVDKGDGVLRQALEWAAVAKCAEMLGCAQAILELVVAYTKQRAQFDRPIGSFQAIQHYCANMATDLEGARVVTYRAAWKISTGKSSSMDASLAKSWVSSVASRLVYLAHQCFGAIGFTQDHDLQLFTRRLKAGEIMFGDESFHNSKIADFLGL